MNLTIAIATWNRAALLAQTLVSLATLRVPDGVAWDIIVCDNNSSDHTRQVVEDAKNAARLLQQPRLSALTYHFEPAQGKSHALNRILREARGDWVLLLDDDVIVDPDWLAAYVRAIERYPKAAVFGGAVLPGLKEPPSRSQRYLLANYPGAFGVLPVERDAPIADPQPTPGGANMALRRAVAAGIGFDPARGMFAGARVAGEDMLMALNIIRQGHEGWLIADAKVLHHTRPGDVSSRRLFRWQQGIGRGWVQERGRPTPGKFGVAWWAWREMGRRALRMMLRWRPWPSRSYYDAVVEAGQYFGYLRAR